MTDTPASPASIGGSALDAGGPPIRRGDRTAVRDHRELHLGLLLAFAQRLDRLHDRRRLGRGEMPRYVGISARNRAWISAVGSIIDRVRHASSATIVRPSESGTVDMNRPRHGG